MSSLFYDSESWRINEKPSRFLPINVKNNMDRACDKCESSKKNKNYKEHFANNQEETAEIFGIHHEEKGLENLTLTGRIKGKRSRRKQQITYLTNLCKCIEEQMP